MCLSPYLSFPHTFYLFVPLLLTTVQFTARKQTRNFILRKKFNLRNTKVELIYRSQVERHIRPSIISTSGLASTTSPKGMLRSILAAIDSNPAWIVSRRRTTRWRKLFFQPAFQLFVSQFFFVVSLLVAKLLMWHFTESSRGNSVWKSSENWIRRKQTGMFSNRVTVRNLLKFELWKDFSKACSDWRFIYINRNRVWIFLIYWEFSGSCNFMNFKFSINFRD